LSTTQSDDVVDRRYEVRGHGDVDHLGKIARADASKPHRPFHVAASRGRPAGRPGIGAKLTNVGVISLTAFERIGRLESLPKPTGESSVKDALPRFSRTFRATIKKATAAKRLR
jgi:hypothetical protein